MMEGVRENYLLNNIDRLLEDDTEEEQVHPVHTLSLESNYVELENIVSTVHKYATESKISVMHINIHSLPAKYDQLNIILNRLLEAR